MRIPKRLLLFSWPLVILLISSCGQQPTKTEQEPLPVVRPSDAVIESVVDASLVDSFGLSLSSQDGEYVFSGEWELDPDEDPNTVYWVLAGTADGGFIPVKRVTSAEAAANSMVHTSQFGRLGSTTFLDAEVQLIHDFLRGSTAPPDDNQPSSDDLIAEVLAYSNLVFMALQQGAGGSVESEAARNTFGAMQEALDALLSDYREVQQALEFQLQRLVEGALAAASQDSRSWFDTDRQLLSTEDAEHLRMIREGAMSRTPQAPTPSFDPAQLQMRMEQLTRDRMDSQDGTPRAQEIAEMRARLQDRIDSATLTTPDNLHELVVCGHEDGPFEYASFDYVLSCENEPRLMLFAAHNAENWGDGATASLQLQQVGSEGVGNVDHIIVQMLNKPNVSITFTPGMDVDVDGGDELRIGQNAFMGDAVPFSIMMEGLSADEHFVAFRVQMFDRRGDMYYTDIIQLDLSHEKFRVAPD